jgi:hypothetical protein
MLNRIVAAVSLVVLARSALGLESIANPHEVTVTLTADNPRAILEVLQGESNMELQEGLYSARGSVTTWKPLCYAPCRVSVRMVDALRVSGDGIEPSSSVLIDPQANELNVRATTGSSGTHVAGVVLLILGGATALCGGTVLLSTALVPYASQFAPVGAVTLGVGAAVGLLGVLLLGMSGTSLQLEGGREGSLETPRLF